VTVLPVGSDAEKADRLHLVQVDLVVLELIGAGQFPGQPAFTRAFGTGTIPAKQLEVVGRLVAVGPLD